MISAHIVHKSLHNSRHLCLHIKPSILNYSWIAGQWVDFSAPLFCLQGGGDFKATQVGGYSICSATGSGTFELCIQKSQHPMSRWLFQEAVQVGQEVYIGQASGDCIFPPIEYETVKKVVCLAGGVGITPLISVWRTIQKENNNPGKPSIDAIMYHGIRDRSTDALFDKEFPEESLFVSSEGRRICCKSVVEQHGKASNVAYYVCGPKSFMDDGIAQLKSTGCTSVQYEHWW
jgi:ferredoxin-NADP reductase